MHIYKYIILYCHKIFKKYQVSYFPNLFYNSPFAISF